VGSEEGVSELPEPELPCEKLELLCPEEELAGELSAPPELCCAWTVPIKPNAIPRKAIAVHGIEAKNLTMVGSFFLKATLYGSILRHKQ